MIERNKPLTVFRYGNSLSIKTGIQGGADEFDKDEPGYKDAMTGAFQYMLSSVNKKLTVKEFQDIHYRCVDKVAGIQISREFKPAQYGFDLSKATKTAKEEWNSELLILSPNIYLNEEKNKVGIDLYKKYLAAYTFFNSQVISSYAEDTEVVNAPKKINEILDNYYKKLSEAKTDDEKLIAIVRVCRQLEIGHFFPDGNQRTIVFVLLNKLLIENKFPPTILDDPNVFDGYLGAQELVDAVKNGQQCFLKLSSEAYALTARFFKPVSPIVIEDHFSADKNKGYKKPNLGKD